MWIDDRFDSIRINSILIHPYSVGDSRMPHHKFIVGRLEINSHVESLFSQHVVLEKHHAMPSVTPTCHGSGKCHVYKEEQPSTHLRLSPLLLEWKRIQQSNRSLSLVWKQETSEGNGTRRGSEDRRRSSSADTGPSLSLSHTQPTHR